MSVSSAANTSAMSTDVMSQDQDVQDHYHEYETQHFGFTPQSFTNGVYNAVNDYIMDGLEVVEGYINTEYKDVISPEQVNEGIQKIQKKISKKIDTAFDTFEAYVKTNIFRIPDKAVLPEDAIKQEKPFTAEDETRILNQVEQYKQKILAVKYANTCLQKELHDIEQAQQCMDSMLAQAQDMNQVLHKVGVSDIKDSMVYASSQLQKRIETLNTVNIVSKNSADEKA